DDPQHGLPLHEPQGDEVRRAQAADPRLRASRVKVAARRAGVGLHLNAGQATAARRQVRRVWGRVPLRRRNVRVPDQPGEVRAQEPADGSQVQLLAPQAGHAALLGLVPKCRWRVFRAEPQRARLQPRLAPDRVAKPERARPSVAPARALAPQSPPGPRPGSDLGAGCALDAPSPSRIVFDDGMSGRTGPKLRIEMLGGFRVAARGRTVEESAWRLRKARALIKLLALTPERSLHREQVIEALWPDLEPTAASNNLRQALFVARRALDSVGDDGGARLELSFDALTRSAEGVSVDVEEFENAADLAGEDRGIDRLRAAIELYPGELLPQDRFEEWASAPREALKERHLALMLGLAGLCQEAGDSDAAIGALQQVLLAEPLHEHAHRELMRIYALTGRRQRALAQFHLLREALRREFEDEPDDDTRRLYQDILARRIGTEEDRELVPAARRADARAAR